LYQTAVGKEWEIKRSSRNWTARACRGGNGNVKIKKVVSVLERGITHLGKKKRDEDKGTAKQTTGLPPSD